MKIKNSIYLLEFKNGQKGNLFRELKRIYTIHTEKEIGCKVNQLYRSKIRVGQPFENKFVKVSLIELI